MGLFRLFLTAFGDGAFQSGKGASRYSRMPSIGSANSRSTSGTPNGVGGESPFSSAIWRTFMTFRSSDERLLPDLLPMVAGSVASVRMPILVPILVPSSVTSSAETSGLVSADFRAKRHYRGGLRALR